jgi:hypothetical protein
VSFVQPTYTDRGTERRVTKGLDTVRFMAIAGSGAILMIGINIVRLALVAAYAAALTPILREKRRGPATR